MQRIQLLMSLTVLLIVCKLIGEANETNGHPSQESDVKVNVENSNIDEPRLRMSNKEQVITNNKH